MKHAIISDIHSNLEALKSVLEDIKKNNIDKIICLGDIIGKGENAHECVNLVRKNCDVIISGNGEIRFTNDAENFKDDELEYKRILWNQSLLTKDDIQFLKDLPLCYEITCGNRLIRMFHATPVSPFNFVNDYDTDMSFKYSMFLPSNNTSTKKVADVVIYGHLHYQFLNTIYNKTLINCGSVGNPICVIQNKDRNSPAENVCVANYLILETNNNDIFYCFKSCNYNIKKELETNKTNIEFENYKKELTTASSRNIQRVYNSFTAQGYDVSKF